MVHGSSAKNLQLYPFLSASLILGIVVNMATQVKNVIDFAYVNGLIAGSKGHKSVTHIPLSLYPFSFPKESFEKVLELSPLFNTLVHRVASDPVWIINTLSNTAKADIFTKRLLDIFIETSDMSSQCKQKFVLGLHRSDYMLNNLVPGSGQKDILQVEMNTIASSFGCLSTKTTAMHLLFNASLNIPDNSAMNSVATGIAKAHGLFLSQQRRAVSELFQGKDVSVLFVVQPNERNFSDQRLLEYEIARVCGASCIRLSLEEINQHVKLSNGSHGFLMYQGTAISVVYYRAGYSPDDYPSDACWQARLLVERSMAIKCPSIAYHLTGCKKVQQALASPGVLERFNFTPQECTALGNVFAGLYSLDVDERKSSDLSLESLKEMVQRNPAGFVMKPQREGGGNNLYNVEMTDALATMANEELKGYIIMERIRPAVQPATFIKEEEISEVLISLLFSCLSFVVLNSTYGYACDRWQRVYASWVYLESSWMSYPQVILCLLMRPVPVGHWMTVMLNHFSQIPLADIYVE